MNVPVEGWNLLNYRNIARNASSKQIKKFIESLDVRLLKKMIETYTESFLSLKPRNFEYLSSNDILKHWKTKQNTVDSDELDGLNPDDIEILKSLKKYCFNARPSIYQKESKLLNTLPIELISYSLSFLSFKELSKRERVCLYFILSSRKYCNLSHFYLHIDSKFIYSLASNEINIDLLRNFKAIKISNSTGHRAVRIFLFVIKKIISESQSSLQSLTIRLHMDRSKNCLFKTILNSVPSLPSLNTFRWFQDHESFFLTDFHNFDNNALVKIMNTKLPHLQHLEIATKREQHYDGLPSFKFVQSILDPSIENTMFLLVKSLHLTDRDLFSRNIIPKILRQMTHLNHLTIDANFENSIINQEIQNDFVSKHYLDGNARTIMAKQSMDFVNTSIKTLVLKRSTTFTGFYSVRAAQDDRMLNILIYFFLHCVNVTDLSLGFGNRLNTKIKWSLLFDLLMEQKTKYNQCLPLSKLQITANIEILIRVLLGLWQTLPIQQNLKYLQYIDLKIMYMRPHGYIDKFNDFVSGTVHLLQQLQSIQDVGAKLQSFSVGMPQQYKSLNFDFNMNNYSSNPVICYNLFTNLKVVNLHFIHRSMFGSDLIPTVLRNALNLQDLSISSQISTMQEISQCFKKDFFPSTYWQRTAIDIINNHQASFYHKSLNKLNLTLSFEHQYAQNTQYILSYFYLICPNITDLSLSLKYGSDVSIAWSLLFDLLIANKTKHNSQPLSRLSVKGNHYLLMNVLNALCVKYLESGYLSNKAADIIKYLESVELNRDYSRVYHLSPLDLKTLNCTLVMFLKRMQDIDSKLKSFQIEIPHNNYDEYGECVLILLQNLPRTLERFAVNCIDAPDSTKNKKYDDISWKIVKCLVNIEVNDQLNIQCIELKGLSLRPKAIQYLQFYFGFQDKLLYDQSNRNCEITFRS